MIVELSIGLILFFGILIVLSGSVNIIWGYSFGVFITDPELLFIITIAVILAEIIISGLCTIAILLYLKDQRII